MSNTPSQSPTALRSAPVYKLALASALVSLACAGASAQNSPAKTLAVEATGIPVAAAASAPTRNVFIVFGSWLESLGRPAVASALSQPAAPVVFEFLAGQAASIFETVPVILGQPELPLLGQAAADAANLWSSGFNYQGMQMTYLVVDASGTRQELRPVSKGLAAGEHYKIRYTASFDAVATIDRVVGDVWSSQRVGQAWPQAGMSVASQSGETVELPLGGGYFVMGASATERYVLTVRHPQAKGQARSDQPIYRQDGVRGSNYVQLVPGGKQPALEQLIAARTGN